MNIADRIQVLRKEKSISQEELANEIGVSRQAVSKWESNQSLPDLEKIVVLSNYFNVSTDYLIKGVHQKIENNTNAIASNVLYISSTFLIALGVICAFANWYENQNLADVFGSFLMHAVGIAGYFIGTTLSTSKATPMIKWLNIVLTLFIPLSLLISFVCNGWASPYPMDRVSILLFIILYLILSAVTYYKLKRKH